MHVVVASSEAVPFAKTGGLADVAGALPLELARLGLQSTLILPAYSCVYNAGIPLEPTGITLQIPIGNKTVPGKILLANIPTGDDAGNEVPVYFIDQPDYFDRPGLYQSSGQDYTDNCERFVFFSRAVMEAIRRLSLRVDVLHCNDWQTGLIPALHKIEYAGVPGFEGASSLLTVHNLAYQGNFWHWDMLLTGLDWKYFNWTQMEFHGRLNLLKTGLIFADAINTVSPTYAREIQTREHGCGLEGVLQNRSNVLYGILNGIDAHEWDPATDQHLAKHYSAQDFVVGKAANKFAVQTELGLPTAAEIPMFAFVGRLAEQKGVDLILEILRQRLVERQEQWVFLGTGDPRIEDRLRQLAREFPNKLSVTLAFADGLAHRIEAAADMFLMPSRFEPCGLSQLYSLRYGTVPIVRSTGGLVDTIVDVNETSLVGGSATGFRFDDYHAGALSETIDRALRAYEQPDVWRPLVKNGMQQDWSWTRSAKDYARLYEALRSKKLALSV